MIENGFWVGTDCVNETCNFIYLFPMSPACTIDDKVMSSMVKVMEYWCLKMAYRLEYTFHLWWTFLHLICMSKWSVWWFRAQKSRSYKIRSHIKSSETFLSSKCALLISRSMSCDTSSLFINFKYYKKQLIFALGILYLWCSFLAFVM